MKIYIGSAGVPLCCPKKDTISGIKCVYNLGLNLMEIQFVRGVRMSKEMAEEAGNVARELGVRLSVHAPYYINLASEREEVISRSIEDWLLKSIELAHIMGASCVVFHPASYGKRSPEETYEIVKKNILRLLDLVEEYDVYILPETMGKKGQFGSLEELFKLVEEINHPKLLLCIDFAHIHARYGGSLKEKQAFTEILERYFEIVEDRKEKFLHIHFSSIEYTEKGEREHLPIEKREPDFEIFVQALKEFDFDVVEIVSESPLLEQDAIIMRDILVREGLMEPIVVEKPVEIVTRKRRRKTKSEESSEKKK